MIVDATLATTGTPEGLYGRRKMTHHLRRAGHNVAFTPWTALWPIWAGTGSGAAGVCGTTVPRKDGDRAAELLNRQFRAEAPNRVWVADFSYLRTWAGFSYVAFIVDVFAQKIVAWHAATDKRTDLVLTPLRIALWTATVTDTRCCPATEHLALEGIAPSIGSVGDAYDNALMDSVIGRQGFSRW